MSVHIIAVRDSHLTGTHAPILNVDVAEWRRFITRIKKGDADGTPVPPGGGELGTETV
jgi:hypothetical protein